MRVKWLELALNDLVEAHAFIAEDNLEAAIRCILKIRAAVDQLARFPRIGRSGRVPDAYELVVSGTPYIVVYRIHPKRIEILSVLHGSRTWPSEFLD